jgi:hypothetical protein
VAFICAAECTAATLHGRSAGGAAQWQMRGAHITVLPSARVLCLQPRLDGGDLVAEAADLRGRRVARRLQRVALCQRGVRGSLRVAPRSALLLQQLPRAALHLLELRRALQRRLQLLRAPPPLLLRLRSLHLAAHQQPLKLRCCAGRHGCAHATCTAAETASPHAPPPL